MPATVEEVFTKRRMVREDGVEVLARPQISAAALEAGYSLDSPMIDDAVAQTTYPGQMTVEEFADFCEKNKDSFLSPEKMAKAVVVVAPSGVITRGSLQQITKKSSKAGSGMTDEEVDALFATLDTDNKGAITAEDLMRAMYGEEGALCLAEQRKKLSESAAAQKEQRDKENAEREERERALKEEEEAANAAAREAEEKAKADADAEAEAKAAEEKAAKEKEEADKKSTGSEKKPKEKAKKGCC